MKRKLTVSSLLYIHNNSIYALVERKTTAPGGMEEVEAVPAMSGDETGAGTADDLLQLDQYDIDKEIENLKAEYERIKKEINGSKDKKAIEKIEKQDLKEFENDLEVVKTAIGRDKKNKEKYAADIDDLDRKLNLLKGFAEEAKKELPEPEVEDKPKITILENKTFDWVWTVHERKGAKDLAKVMNKIAKIQKKDKFTEAERDIAIKELQDEFNAALNDETKDSEVKKFTVTFKVEKVQEKSKKEEKTYWRFKGINSVPVGSKTTPGALYIEAVASEPDNTQPGSSNIKITLNVTRAADTGETIDVTKIKDVFKFSEDPLYPHTFVLYSKNVKLDILAVLGILKEKPIKEQQASTQISLNIKTDNNIPSISFTGTGDDEIFNHFSYRESFFSKVLYYWGDMETANPAFITLLKESLK